MRYYKDVQNGYIYGIGTGDGEGIEITETEYNTILEVIENAPQDTETHYYMLNAETVQYEAIERDEPIIIPDPKQALIDEIIAEVNA